MTIRFEDVKSMFRDHMEDQPYKIVCGGCGDDLEIASEVDNDLDLNITVYPCRNCSKEWLCIILKRNLT